MCLPLESTGLQPHEVLLGFSMPMPFDWKPRVRELDDCAPRERVNRKETQEATRRIQGYVEYGAYHTK